MDSLSASRINLESTIFFVISICMQYLLRDCTSNSSYFSRSHYLFRKVTLFREFSMDLLSPSRLLFELILFFRIHYLFCEFTLNPRSFSLWPHHEITVNSLFVSKIHLEFIFFAKSLRILPLNSLYFSWFHYEFTIFSQNNFEYIFLFVNSS